MSGQLRITSFNDGSRYSEHDDRVGPPRGRGYSRRSRSTWDRGHRRGRGRGGPGPRSRLDEEGDSNMGEAGDNRYPRQRFSPYGGGGGGGGGRSRRPTRGLYTRGRGRDRYRTSAASGGPDQWFKITVPQGKKASKEFILKSLTDLSDRPFIPHNFCWNLQAAQFFVKGSDVANALKACSKRISLPNGFKMLVFANKSEGPRTDLNPENLNDLKVALGQRWDAERLLLNLSSLHLDSTFQAKNLVINLHDYKTMKKICELIKESVPQIKALDLRENNLRSLVAAADLVSLADLTTLSLQGNKLANINEVDRFRELKLTELILEGNPLCDSYRSKDVYISDVRKRFPKLRMLDGNELPEMATFDLDTTKLPPAKGSFIANSDIDAMIKAFVTQYIKIYDQDKRDELISFYHDDAQFSLSVCRTGRGGHVYITESRNLTRVTDALRQEKLVKKGRLGIVGSFNQLPKTSHDVASFVVDTPFISPSMVLVVLSGIFKEREEVNTLQLRAFTRVWTLVPGSPTPLVINEMLTLTAPSTNQIKNSFKGPAPTPSPSPDQTTSPAAGPSAAVSPVVPAQRDAAVTEFSKQSGMNPQWSKQCLEMNEWDFDKAAQNFMELKSQNKIPAEAFVHVES